MVKKAAIIVGFILLAIVALLWLAPVLFQKQISQRVKAEINERINASVDYKSLSISLFQSFPDVSISLSGFTVIGQGEFSDDTIASVKDFSFAINLMSVITGRGYEVVSLNLQQPVIKFRVNSKGQANWDIVKQLPVTPIAPDKGQSITDSTFQFEINNWKIEHAHFEFRNDTAKTLFYATDINYQGNQLVRDTGFYYNTTADIKELSYSAGGITYLNKAKLNAAIKFSSSPTGLYQMDDSRVTVNDLQLMLKGSFKNTQSGQQVNLAVQSVDSSFKKLLSLIPAVNDSSFTQSKSSGSFSFSGTINGLNNETQSPAFSFKLNVKDGLLQKPNFAQPVKNIFVEATVLKPQGPMDSAVISINRLHVETGNDSVNARLLVITPSSNANIMAELKGSIDLAGLSQFYAVDGVKQLTGALHVDLRLKGRKSDLDHKNYKLIQASGKMEAQNVVFQKKDWPVTLQVKDADFSVVCNAVSLNLLKAQLGKSNIQGSGKFENVIPYLAQQSQLKINLALNADVVDLRELTKGITPVKKAPQNNTANPNTSNIAGKRTSSANNVDLVIHIAANKVYDDKLVLSNLHGTVESTHDTFRIKDMSADLFGGKVMGTVVCNNYNAAQAGVNFNMKASNIDIAQVYQNIDDAEKTAPAMKYLSGAFSGDISGNGKVKMGDCLKLEGITADGNLNYPDLKINEMPVLMEIGKLAKVKSLDHLDAKNVQSTFHFKNGNSTVDPTDIKFTNGYKLNFKGTNYANQTIDADIALDVPVKEFGSIASLAQNLLSGFMSVPDNVHFGFKITGKNTDPKVKVVNVGTSGN